MFEQVFAHLLVMLDGDTDRALDQLESIGQRYDLFDDELSPEDVRQHFADRRLIRLETGQGTTSLTSKGEQFVRQRTLDDIFRGLDATGAIVGDHQTRKDGSGGEATGETRAWQFGDELHDIDFRASLHASFHRGLDSQLQEDDLRITEREQHTSVATCLLLDISHSMVLYGENRITPAKRVAIALAELIKRKYPKDALHIILFGDVAREVSLRELTYAGVGPYHTNTEMALQLASQILSRKRHANKQIFMITDGKPTALLRGEQLHINTFGLDPEIRAATLKAAAECRRQRIPITTFMIAQDPLLMEFVEDLTQINHGRAFYADLRDLERSVFVDFLRNRRKRSRGRGGH
jgi:uncharacterized protein with von Willebrand factor type A (vWA) domain